MNDLVSIILPVYNVQEYLNICVDSIVNQTYSNLEIILVDDGSTDGSSLICDKWASCDKRIRVIHKINEGAGMARNAGLDVANGSFVMFVDSDDYIDTDTVRRCMNEHNEFHSDVVFFGRCNLYADGSVKKLAVPSDKVHFKGDSVKNEILPGLFTYKHGIGISVWGKFFDIKLFRDNKIRFYSEREVLSEDACITLEIFAHVKSLTIIPENFYYYRQNAEGLSHKYKRGHQTRVNNFLAKSNELCEALGYPQKVFTCVCVRYHMYALSGMKRIISSNLPKEEKKKELWGVFRDPVLHKTFSSQIMRCEKKSMRLFWTMLKCRMYVLCYYMLRYKTKVKL